MAQEVTAILGLQQEETGKGLGTQLGTLGAAWRLALLLVLLAEHLSRS